MVDETADSGNSELLFLGDGASMADRIAELLQKTPLFSGFSLEEIRRLAAFMGLFRAGRGVAIVREGDPGDYMMLLLEGHVNVLKNDHQNRQKLISEILPGQTFGEMSMVDGEPRFATCVTAAPVLYAVLSRETLARIVNDEPRLGAKLLVELLELLTQRLRQTSDMLVDYLKI
jgi:CRP/FNR family transcriptional regulator, cyclic AMP receptor protein